MIPTNSWLSNPPSVTRFLSGGRRCRGHWRQLLPELLRAAHAGGAGPWPGAGALLLVPGPAEPHGAEEH